MEGITNAKGALFRFAMVNHSYSGDKLEQSRSVRSRNTGGNEPMELPVGAMERSGIDC